MSTCLVGRLSGTPKVHRIVDIIGYENKSMEGYQKKQKGSSEVSLGATLNERILNERM
jgi:hypothetical protein